METDILIKLLYHSKYQKDPLIKLDLWCSLNININPSIERIGYQKSIKKKQKTRLQATVKCGIKVILKLGIFRRLIMVIKILKTQKYHHAFMKIQIITLLQSDKQETESDYNSAIFWQSSRILSV